MVLVDTSVWIDFLNSRSVHLGELLASNDVLMHAFVIGELVCGNLPARKATILFLQELPVILAAGLNDVLRFVDKHALMATGLSYIDMHLLAASAKRSAFTLPRNLWRSRISFPSFKRTVAQWSARSKTGKITCVQTPRPIASMK